MKFSRATLTGLLWVLGLSVATTYGCSGDKEAEEPVAAEGEAAPSEEAGGETPAAEEAEPAAEPAEPAQPAASAEPEGFTAAPVTRYVTSYALNVRTGPGKDFPVKRHVKWGDKIEVVVNGEWAKLGAGEYVSINRLGETPPKKGGKKHK